MQLNIMNLVKSGKMSIDEALNQARSGKMHKQKNFEIEVKYELGLKTHEKIQSEPEKIHNAIQIFI